MMTRLVTFVRGERGAVTIDWVVITAVVAGLGTGIAVMIADVTTDESNSVGAWLEEQTVATY